ncbi:MAG TPA: chemotaxis protein CheX [Candidatus Hydrogenedentes bacterium]|nr:chemotaxis protein CheX [Candidatus Hydrogenedentota bacterium]HOL75716.1 chemotaxis protein CheX [Candidatus Hydrogenedentota bacterium]HPO84291.1 chemotaxis protein CheX [Candidatus Hydrogenedentota bacterium]
MKTEHEAIIQRVFPEVLEKMAFVFAEPADAQVVNELVDEKWLKASMAFSGHFGGELALIIPEPLCAVFAENMLGAADENSPQRAHDAFKEVLNVTCGNILTEVAGEGPVFDLTVPQVNPLSNEDLTTLLQGQDLLAFIIEDQPAFLQFSVFS